MKNVSPIAFLLIAIFAVGSASTAAEPSPTEQKEKRRGPGFAFICLNSGGLAGDPELKAALKEWVTVSESAPAGFDRKSGDTTDSVAFEADGKRFMIALQKAPIPQADIDYACENSFLWPDAKQALTKQTAHLVVTTFDHFESPAAEGLALSRVLAAATECHDAAAVYWGHANVVHEPSAFREMIRDAGTGMDNIPVLAWIGFLKGSNEDGSTDFYTSGLDAFGAMDLEVVNSRRKPSKILNLLAGMSAYLIDAGNVISDGDTVGGPDEEKVRTKHAASVIGREKPVLRVEF